MKIGEADGEEYYYRLSGEVQPRLQSRVAVLTEDRNHDGAVDWMEAALLHRDHLTTLKLLE